MQFKFKMPCFVLVAKSSIFKFESMAGIKVSSQNVPQASLFEVDWLIDWFGICTTDCHRRSFIEPPVLISGSPEAGTSAFFSKMLASSGFLHSLPFEISYWKCPRPNGRNHKGTRALTVCLCGTKRDCASRLPIFVTFNLLKVIFTWLVHHKECNVSKWRPTPLSILLGSWHHGSIH